MDGDINDWSFSSYYPSAVFGGKTMTAVGNTIGEQESNMYASALGSQWCPVNTNFSCIRRNHGNSNCSESEEALARKQAVEWSNSILSQSPRLTWTKDVSTTSTSIPPGLGRVFKTHFQCRDRTPPLNWVVITSYMPWEVNDGGTPNKSICSLNSQNLNLSYSSASLNVNGLTQSTNLNVTCGTGDAQDYQLKLTGTNVTNGRLNFTNGVSAQVLLNGTQVQANGSGIQLNGLTTRSISVSATLTGTAATSGPSGASGVLVLDVQ
ncbi:MULTISPECIES: hypothetical protein [unclassified Providencia]|uniref:hypothetical protein n=1 Tax=unclassified Providencia TaxID=2633465 RepID=UPI0023490D72|nr:MULTISPECIES: hypothetical protein [unclassified Providencia]